MHMRYFGAHHPIFAAEFSKKMSKVWLATLDTKYKVQTRSIFSWGRVDCYWGEMVSGAN